MEKMTYTKALDAVLTGAEMTEEVMEKLQALKGSLEKRADSKSAKPTKAQREAAEFTEAVFNFLTEVPVRCGEMATAMGVSGQKMSAALSKLVKAGRIVKTVGEKKVSMFSRPVEE